MKFRLKLLHLSSEAFSLRYGLSELFFRAIDLKPPEVLVDSGCSLLDIPDKVSHGTVGIEQGWAGHDTMEVA